MTKEEIEKIEETGLRMFMDMIVSLAIILKISPNKLANQVFSDDLTKERFQLDYLAASIQKVDEQKKKKKHK